jgi:hypothetical protein
MLKRAPSGDLSPGNHIEMRPFSLSAQTESDNGENIAGLAAIKSWLRYTTVAMMQAIENGR